MRFAAPIAILAALALLAGCGDSGDGITASDRTTTGAAKVAASEARAAFVSEPSCQRPSGASRWGCSVDSLRCQAVVVDRGWSVSCSEPGRSVSFVLRR